MSFLHNMNKGTDTNALEKFCIDLCSYNTKLTSEKNTWERNPLFHLACDLQLQHANTWHTAEYSAPSAHFRFSSVLCQPLSHTQAVSELPVCTCIVTGIRRYISVLEPEMPVTVCTTIVVLFIYFCTLMYLIFIFIFVSILFLQNNQNSMLLYDCIYFIQDNLNFSF